MTAATPPWTLLAVDDEQRVLVIQQYRHPIRTRDWELPAGLLDSLSVVGTAHGTTLFMVLLAAFEVLLARHTGSDDLVVGIPVANRNELASESLMGSLVNTLALRVPVGLEQSFLTVLKQVREIAIDAYTHQVLPFERLVTSMRLERRAGESPLVTSRTRRCPGATRARCRSGRCTSRAARRSST